MKPEQLKCSIESAKRLKELEINQDSFFYYQVFNTTGDISLRNYRL